jgi:hypothetical protein
MFKNHQISFVLFAMSTQICLPSKQGQRFPKYPDERGKLLVSSSAAATCCCMRNQVFSRRRALKLLSADALEFFDVLLLLQWFMLTSFRAVKLKCEIVKL